MPLVLVGVNHRTTPLALREQLSVTDAQLTDALGEVSQLPGVDGASIVSTCNRVETIVSASSEDVIESLVHWLTGRARVARAELEAHLYVLRHGDVVKHLFRVASGLDPVLV